MPRKPRVKSATGIYHIIFRGVNRRQVFFDDEDYKTFLNQLKRYKPICGYKLYAYCLMGNHIHLLMREGHESLEKTFKRIGPAFSYRHNGKYERVGHMFQDRYYSEPVENPFYFLRVIRYIFQNPVKAGICNKPEEYKYSNAYKLLNEKDDFTDSDEIFELISPEELRKFCNEKNDDNCLDIEDTNRFFVSDELAEQFILEEYGTLSPDPGKGASRKEFLNSFAKLRKQFVSIRQFSRITGVSRYILMNH